MGAEVNSLAGIGYSLIAASIWTILLLVAASGLSETRRAYFFGVGSAVTAYVVAMLVLAFIALFFPATPVWVTYVLIPPLIEESARLVAADTVYRKSTWRHWVVFGVGYALFESGLKLADALAIAFRSPIAEAWIGVLVPIIPFLLHVFLSLFMCLLLQRGVGLMPVWLLSMALHGAHNWSALVFLPTNGSDLMAMVLVRSAILLAVIRATVWLAKRPSETPVEPAG